MGKRSVWIEKQFRGNAGDVEVVAVVVWIDVAQPHVLHHLLLASF